MSDKNELIYEMLKELRQEQREHQKEMHEHQQESLKWHASTDHRLENLEEDMRRHIEGVMQNRDSVSILRKRVDVLEKPLAVKEVIKNIAILGAAAGSILTIVKLIEQLLN